jgi:hypothetical protein
MNRAKFYPSVSLAVVLLLGMTAPAHAITTLTSSPLVVTTGEFLVCALTNVGPADITVTSKAIGLDGVGLIDNSNTVPPGQVALIAYPGPLSRAYCMFTGNFNRGVVRANAQVGAISVAPAQAVGE